MNCDILDLTLMIDGAHCPDCQGYQAAEDLFPIHQVLLGGSVDDGKVPESVYIDMRMIPFHQIPVADKEEFDKWLYAVFQRKADMLRRFHDDEGRVHSTSPEETMQVTLNPLIPIGFALNTGVFLYFMITVVMASWTGMMALTGVLGMSYYFGFFILSP